LILYREDLKCIKEMSEKNISKGLYWKLMNNKPKELSHLDRKTLTDFMEKLFSSRPEIEPENRVIRVPWSKSFWDTMKAYQNGQYGIKPLVKLWKKAKLKEWKEKNKD